MGKSKRRRPKKTNTFDPTGLMNVNGSAEVEAKAEADINAENGVTVTDRAYDTIVSLVQKVRVIILNSDACVWRYRVDCHGYFVTLFLTWIPEAETANSSI